MLQEENQRSGASSKEAIEITALTVHHITRD
jgi:hypothetical protein